MSSARSKMPSPLVINGEAESTRRLGRRTRPNPANAKRRQSSRAPRALARANVRCARATASSATRRASVARAIARRARAPDASTLDRARSPPICSSSQRGATNEISTTGARGEDARRRRASDRTAQDLGDGGPLSPRTLSQVRNVRGGRPPRRRGRESACVVRTEALRRGPRSLRVQAARARCRPVRDRHGRTAPIDRRGERDRAARRFGPVDHVVAACELSANS